MEFLLPVMTVLYGILGLIKDWKCHEHHWRRIFVLILVVLIGMGTGVNNYKSGRASEKRDQDIRDLKGQVTNLVQTSTFNAQRDALAQELNGIHDDIRDGFARLGAAIKPHPAKQRTVTPPPVPHVQIVQRPTPAKGDAAPYGLQVILQPDTQMSAAFRIECDGPISDGDFYIAAVGAMMSVQTGVDGNAYIISIGFPQIGHINSFGCESLF